MNNKIILLLCISISLWLLGCKVTAKQENYITEIEFHAKKINKNFNAIIEKDTNLNKLQKKSILGWYISFMYVIDELKKSTKEGFISEGASPAQKNAIKILVQNLKYGDKYYIKIISKNKNLTTVQRKFYLFEYKKLKEKIIKLSETED